MTRQKETIISYLKKHLDSARFKHTLGTCRVVEELAARHKLPLDKAIVAALLHDAGKGFKPRAMIAYVKKHKVKLPEKELVIRLNPSLLHSYISADIAKREFNVTDKDTLSAIELHTVGGPGMSLLSKVLYIADSISPDRRHPDINRMRRLALKDIDGALKATMANKMRFVIYKNGWLHPEAVKAWNYLVKNNRA